MKFNDIEINDLHVYAMFKKMFVLKENVLGIIKFLEENVKIWKKIFLKAKT